MKYDLTIKKKRLRLHNQINRNLKFLFLYYTFLLNSELHSNPFRSLSVCVYISAIIYACIICLFIYMYTHVYLCAYNTNIYTCNV